MSQLPLAGSPASSDATTRCERTTRHVRLAPLTALVLSAVCCAGEPAARAPQKRPDRTFSDESYRRARAILERGVEVMGGADRIIHGGPLFFHAEGTLDKRAERQGRAPDASSPGGFRETFAVEPAADRVAWEYREDRYDGTYEWLREVYDQDRHVIVVLQSGLVVTLVEPGNDLARRKLYRRVPHLLLDEVAARPEALRFLGRADAGLAITGELATGETLTLFFDPQQGHLSRVEYLADLESYGDAVVAWEYDDYAPLEGIGAFPRSYRSAVAGSEYTDMRVVEVELGVTGELFRAPEGFRRLPPDTLKPGAEDASSSARVDTIGPGLYRIVNLRGGFHPMFVEFDDFVLAVDAPAGFPLLNELPAGDVAPGPSSAWLSERYLDLIRQAIPTKPVRYVVITHFHNDHAGGLRAFAAEGTTVLAPPSAEEAIRELVDAPHTLAPDRLSRAPRPLDLEIVEGSRTISDGTRRLEILDVGDNPHCEHMLVVRLPGEDVMFVSDLLDPTRVENYPKDHHAPLDRFFGEWLERQGFRPETVYTMHGSGLVTRAHLDQLGSGNSNQ